MAIYKSRSARLVEQQRKIEKQAAEMAQLQANQDYIAMMSDIELDTDEETEESEVTE